MAKTFKKKAIESLSRLPDDANRDDVLYRVQILHGLDKADEQIANGQTVSHEQIINDIEAEHSATT